SREGDYYVGRRQVRNPRPQTLRRAIEQVLGDKRDVPVVVRADARAPWQAVVTVMDVLGGLGLDRLSLATVQPAGERR
ncbi:MAG: biopolymer transporter ExbD, partial [Gammaproteobacteria bacterium]